ncbi:uncharacterized protein AB675_9135 [Cyphellophora attinorum]|uniref:Zn(2)-C6 fungal-type domain-containing protein n=1 Tax=Cyphellophora attinorum TaxID=1664694 RepID=A0A0N1P1W3_9EURO|nr:uncharacterized protein AB675_9135 [Phialophora attinorum]KPI41407.1 hypothetical protein AB675_9135 [Phialophora attinorum]
MATEAVIKAGNLSKIACHNCRKRKVKCDRELPACSICSYNNQVCSYPDRVLKPGPKLGSKNARSKRRRSSVDDDTLQGDRHPHQPGSGTGPECSPMPGSPATLNDNREMQSLSFIIHPSHELTSPGGPKHDSPSHTFANGGAFILAACSAMHITSDVFVVLVENYFKTFMSFRLFPKTRFWSHLREIEDEESATALLAAIVAFAVKLWEPNESEVTLNTLVANLSTSSLINLAIKSADKALTNCGDDPPPLHLLQALVLISHWLLIQGVRGRAWRYLGVCIRVAYEINLHLVDSGRPQDWIDEDPSPWAWFIIINSIMKDAQTISSPMGVDKAASMDSLDARSAAQYFAEMRTERIEETRKRLTTYYNAARYFSMALPQSLKYRGQYLSFERGVPANGQGGVKMLRDLHTGIYSIHLMTQLAFLMTLKYHLFRRAPPTATVGNGIFPQDPDSANQNDPEASRSQCRSQKDVDEYFEAASSILNITNRSNDQLHRYINPFLVNTIWLAAAVQLLKRELFCTKQAEKDLVTSNFEVLRMSYDMFIEFWRSNDTAKKNLAALQNQLKAFQAKTRSDHNASATHAATKPNNPTSQMAQPQLDGFGSNGAGAQVSSTPGQQLHTPNSIGNGSTDIAGQSQQNWPAPDFSAADPMQQFDMQNFDFDFLDPFSLPNDFDFNAGMDTYNNFGDVFSGSVF